MQGAGTRQVGKFNRQDINIRQEVLASILRKLFRQAFQARGKASRKAGTKDLQDMQNMKYRQTGTRGGTESMISRIGRK